jgi:hypothetical protein
MEFISKRSRNNNAGRTVFEKCEFFTAMIMKTAVLWDVTPCSDILEETVAFISALKMPLSFNQKAGASCSSKIW